MASGKASPHVTCKGPLGIPFQSVPDPNFSFVAEIETSGLLCNADMYLGVPLESPQESQARSRVETCTSAFLPSGSSSIRLPSELTQGSVAFPRGATGLSQLQPSCESILGVIVETVQGNQVHLEWTETFGGLLEWWRDPWSSSRLSC